MAAWPSNTVDSRCGRGGFQSVPIRIEEAGYKASTGGAAPLEVTFLKKPVCAFCAIMELWSC
jgi:hypothetical protein